MAREKVTKRGKKEAPAPKGPGASSRLTPEIIEDILEAISNGASVRHACAEVGTTDTTFKRHVRKDAELSLQYARARRDCCESRVSQLLDVIANEPDVQRARLISDAIKWEASKLHPDYIDKQQLEHKGTLADALLSLVKK